MKISDLWKLLISFGATFLVAAIGSLSTTSQIQGWYVFLNKTVITPPNWVFGPAWTLLFILMALAVFLVWRRRGADKKENTALILFGIQLILNVMWSIIFFGSHQILLAFFEIILLWVAILLTIIWFAKSSKLAAWLLVPYIGWVSFAAVLNFLTWLAN